MTEPDDTAAALRDVLADHGVRAVEDEIAALAARASMIRSAAARKRRGRAAAPMGWNAEERAAAVAHTHRLLSYREALPRGGEVTAEKCRARLEKLVDRLPVLLLLTATRRPDGTLLNFDLKALRDALREDTESPEQLTAFLEAVNALPEPVRLGRPRAPYVPIVRSVSGLWFTQFGPNSKAASIGYPRATGVATLTGPLADLLRAVFEVLHVPWPGDEPVHQQLRKLKNPET